MKVEFTNKQSFEERRDKIAAWELEHHDEDPASHLFVLRCPHSALYPLPGVHPEKSSGNAPYVDQLP